MMGMDIRTCFVKDTQLVLALYLRLIHTDILYTTTIASSPQRKLAALRLVPAVAVVRIT
jgi:hypothetical protein